MSGKSTSKRSIKKPKEKKIKLKHWALILLAILIALAFIVFSIYIPLKQPTKPKSSTPSTKSGIPFQKEGTLTIFPTSNSSPLFLDIEVAENDAERMRGLMDRYNLPENAGMLFIFEKDEPRSFWMKNTFISLDIIYINSNKEIVSIQKYTQPKTTSSIPSEKPAMYVLEVNAGFTDSHGIKPGDKIEFTY